MKHTSLSFLFAALIFTAFATTTSFAQAQEANAKATCAVPVCDIQLKLDELRALDPAARYAFYNDLFEATKEVTDHDSLVNLLEFGQKAYAMSKLIDTDEWVYTKAGEITNRSVERLLTQPPIDSAVLTKYYQSFIGDSIGASFSALVFWKTQISDGKVTDATELSELIKFARNAREISTQLKHDQYVITTATDIIALASNRMVRVNPFMEGIYEIKTVCTKAKDPLCRHFNTVAIMITDDVHGIAVSFAANGVTTPNFNFMKAEVVNGVGLENSKDNFENQNAGFNFEIDPVTLEIKGTISSSRLVNDIKFTGKKTFGNDRAYRQTPKGVLPKSTELPAAFKGYLNLKNSPKFPINLVLRYIDRNLVATMFGQNLKVEFGSGFYIPAKGILTLVSTQNAMTVKLTLNVYIDDQGKMRASGTGLGLATSTSYGIELVQQ